MTQISHNFCLKDSLGDHKTMTIVCDCRHYACRSGQVAEISHCHSSQMIRNDLSRELVCPQLQLTTKFACSVLQNSRQKNVMCGSYFSPDIEVLPVYRQFDKVYHLEVLTNTIMCYSSRIQFGICSLEIRVFQYDMY